MDNKNIIFKRTLKEYNKRYRHHKNLLKFTKKEVEEFDKTANTVGQFKLLDHNNWWFIDGTYYQAPRALRPYWFRNLNAGAQTAICLLGAGVIATGASLPFILKLGQTVEPTITISGADFDKAESHIELHKESTIKLKEQSGKTITGIEYVKVDDKQLADTQYSYDESTKIVTIKAEAMTSTKIEIKVKTGGEPTVIKVTSVKITNTTTEVKVGEKLELTTEVLPENATNKELEWSMDGGGEGDADFVEEGGKTYLKGKTAGQIGITATAKDGSGKSDTKSFTVKENVTTKADFINAYKDLRTKFNNEKNKTYKPSQIKVNSWNGEYFFGAAKTLSDLTYDTTSNRSAIFKFKDNGGNEQSHEFGTNLLSDDDLDTLLKSETESTVTYTINDNYIQYSKSALPGEKGLYDLTVNKDGYIISYSINTDDKDEEFSLNITGNPEIYYNIDWATTQFELVSEQSKTLYEYAQEATKIEFVYRDDTSGVCVGEDIGEGQEPVYASFKTEDEEKTLSVWSAGKISFTDNDCETYGFFQECSSVTSFDFSNIDTSKVTNMSYMFNNCSNLISLDLSSFETSKVTQMYNMFCNCECLESVNVSSFDTPSVVDMSSMFSGCLSLKTLDVSNFDTSSVEDMCDMFCWCLSLKTLDLSSFNTEKVEDMSEMFKQDKEEEVYENNLTTIYVGENFSTEAVSSGECDENMFSGCTHLVGGKGTEYDSNYVDKTYARIDGGTSNPGYFTDAKEIPTSDDWFTFTPIEEELVNVAYSISGTQTTAPCPSNFSIPSTHKGEDGIELPVTKIDDYGFDNAYENKIELLVIPSSIKEIGKKSFEGVIDENTNIRFKDTTHTWKIEGDETVPEFNPSAASKDDVLKYLTGEYTWSKNKSEKEIFLEKYQTALNKFYESEDAYTAEQIKIDDDDCRDIKYGTHHEYCYIKDHDGEKRFLAGTKTSGSEQSVILGVDTIKSKIEEYEKQSGYTFEYADDVPSVIIKDANDNVVYEATFNNDGYVTKYKDSNTEYTVQYN